MPKVIEVPVFAIYDDDRVAYVVMDVRHARAWTENGYKVAPAVLTLDLEKKA